jgi:UDP-N-acetylglucosamine acyltransferase
MSDALDQIENEVEMNSHVRRWLDFCRHSKRGLIGFQGISAQALPEEDFDELEELLEEKV